MEPANVFSTQLLGTLPESEISEIQRRQSEMSLSIQRANSSLAALNEFSAVKWADLYPRFEAHTKLIKELQSDLDHVFRKIRSVKTKLGLPNLDNDDDDDDKEEEEGEEEEGEELAAVTAQVAEGVQQREEQVNLEGRS
ncbi:hypothetical protein BGZ76_003370 [Entomortierella beljakovae]|nr:hypothetical protein BGZ76_003370 [Entomortierella beljakovae]